MSKTININLTSKELDEMEVRKYSIDNKPKIWVSNGILYKKDEHDTIKTYKEEFEMFREYEELKDCVFPENTFTVDNSYVGYTTPYFEKYKSICYRMNKNKYSINQKKKIMKKIVKTLIKLNENDIVHADLNTSNVICDGKNIKLIDFDRIRIKDYDDPTIYNWRIREQINYLNIVLMTVLLDTNLIGVMESEYKEFINNMTFTNEFKEYLLNCTSSKEKEISKELIGYIDSIKKKDIQNGKELVKTLQL